MTSERLGDVRHVDCQRPRSLSPEERTLLFEYCWTHPVVECAVCAQRFRKPVLGSDLLGSHSLLCPRCRTDLTESLRGHLYTCPVLPEEVRQRVRDARDAAQKLVKRSRQLTDRADVLMREAESAVSALRETMSQLAALDPQTLRPLIRARLEDGDLPPLGIAVAVSGARGDGSKCGACDRILAQYDLMMLLKVAMPLGMSSIALHADCFRVWEQERRSFRSISDQPDQA